MNNEEKTVTCRYCGKPLDQDASFCGSCGIYIYQLPDDLPGNNSWKDDTLGMCSYCSRLVPLARKYCIFCGAPLHLSEHQRKWIAQNRSREVKCHILFHLNSLSAPEIQKIKGTLKGLRMLDVDKGETLQYNFSFHYNEPSTPFLNELFYKMIRSLFLDLGKEYPNLSAEANFTYQAKLINMLNSLDDFGGYMTITLSDGVVKEEDTPIV